jgi:hypothetical protein
LVGGGKPPQLWFVLKRVYAFFTVALILITASFLGALAFAAR